MPSLAMSRSSVRRPFSVYVCSRDATYGLQGGGAAGAERLGLAALQLQLAGWRGRGGWRRGRCGVGEQQTRNTRNKNKKADRGDHLYIMASYRFHSQSSPNLKLS
jgi:hypothetical protein